MIRALFQRHNLAAEFEAGILSEMTYYALDRKLSEEVRSIARKRGVSVDTLPTPWVQEKLQQIS